MRENSGGFLSQAVKIAGLFVPNGIIVISKYHDGEARYTRDVDGKMYYSGPLILLVSKASASAAEIVTGALQDYGVALVAGDERTYGKGTMQYQTITDVQASNFYKVTVGRYYTLSGRSTQIEGIQADIVLPTEYAPYNIGERFLEFPLSGDYLKQHEIPKNGISVLPPFQYPRMEKRGYFPWKGMLAVLKENSKKRIEKDANYQAFLRKLQLNDSEFFSKTLPTSHDPGLEDLQMKESVNILKDMIYMSQTQTSMLK
jgi:carboxyl-terminal processing protease